MNHQQQYFINNMIITDKGDDVYEVKVLRKRASLLKQLEYSIPVIMDPTPDDIPKRKSYMEQIRECLNL